MIGSSTESWGWTTISKFSGHLKYFLKTKKTPNGLFGYTATTPGDPWSQQWQDLKTIMATAWKEDTDIALPLVSNVEHYPISTDFSGQQLSTPLLCADNWGGQSRMQRSAIMPFVRKSIFENDSPRLYIQPWEWTTRLGRWPRPWPWRHEARKTIIFFCVCADSAIHLVIFFFLR